MALLGESLYAKLVDKSSQRSRNAITPEVYRSTAFLSMS